MLENGRINGVRGLRKDHERIKEDGYSCSIPGIDFPILVENYIGKVVSVTPDINLNLNDLAPIHIQTETNSTRSYLDCYAGTTTFFLMGIIFSPPEIKFNIRDLTSTEMKQYVSDSCNFYYNKTGVWLSGTINELDKQIIQKYGAEFMQKVKEPESLKLRDETYINLNTTK